MNDDDLQALRRAALSGDEDALELYAEARFGILWAQMHDADVHLYRGAVDDAGMVAACGRRLTRAESNFVYAATPVTPWVTCPACLATGTHRRLRCDRHGVDITSALAQAIPEGEGCWRCAGEMAEARGRNAAEILRISPPGPAPEPTPRRAGSAP